jgi:hypothetical protein
MRYNLVTEEMAKDFYSFVVISYQMRKFGLMDDVVYFQRISGKILSLLEMVQMNEMFSDDLFKLELNHRVNIISNREDIVAKYGASPYKGDWVLGYFDATEKIVK